MTPFPLWRLAGTGGGAAAALRDSCFHLGGFLGRLGGAALAPQLIPDAVDGFQGRKSAVADGGVQIVDGAIRHFFEHRREVFPSGDFRQGQPGVLELGIKAQLAPGHVFLPLLLLEPLADLRLRACAGLGDVHPVAAGAVGGLGGVSTSTNVARFAARGQE